MKKNFILMILIAAFFAFGCDLANKSQTASNDTSNLEAATTPTPANSKKPEPSPSPAPKVERDLLSFAEGTIIVQPAFEYHSAPAFGPIALIDSTDVINWVSDDGAAKTGFVFVLEMPEKAAFKSLVFDNDTAGFGGEIAGAKDFTVEVSDVSATSGFQEILSASLKKGENNQRFPVAKSIAGRWVRATFKNNHGDPDDISVAEMRGYGDAPLSALSTNLSGTYAPKNDNGDYHIKQDGTSLSGCYEPADNYSEPAVFTGGVDGNIAKITWSEKRRDGSEVEDKSFLMVFPRDAKTFFTATMSISGVGDYEEIKRKSSAVGVCKNFNAEKITAKDQIGDELKKDGRAAVYGINFDFNSDVIRPESKNVLEQITALLKENADWKMTVEGHTDNVGGETFNQTLSDKRAKAVKEYLTKAGIAAERLQAVGKGLTTPVASNENEIGRAQNRRVELVKQ
ncbi:MAG TPA: OmpA family protein [Pyrinomonadaceae bacterium]|nr:OmpA family protein [Pyrinomonadaceae bacterium]